MDKILKTLVDSTMAVEVYDVAGLTPVVRCAHGPMCIPSLIMRPCLPPQLLYSTPLPADSPPYDSPAYRPVAVPSTTGLSKSFDAFFFTTASWRVKLIATQSFITNGRFTDRRCVPCMRLHAAASNFGSGYC